MEKTKLVNLPIIGRVQHGEKVDNKVKEYGYFIAKIQDNHMQTYLDRFDKLFKGKQSIDIEFFNEDPLTKKYVRYNQSGEVCHCLEGLNQATQKVKNGWQQVQCAGSECQYRQKNESGKCACNRIGWLKFMIPSVSTDRIFLMRITGQTSINQLSDYINLQKAQGKSIKGHYTLFLQQKEQSNNLGQTFSNYVLDILKNENVSSNKPISQIPQKDLVTQNIQENSNKLVNKEVSQSADTTTKSSIENTTTVKKDENKENTEKEVKSASTKKQTKSKAKKTEAKQTEKSEQTESSTNYYGLLSTSTIKITTKTGEQKEYLVGQFVDMDDKIFNIIINPQYADELSECDLGTFVTLDDIREIEGKKFAMKLEFVDKRLKNKAA